VAIRWFKIVISPEWILQADQVGSYGDADGISSGQTPDSSPLHLPNVDRLLGKADPAAVAIHARARLIISSSLRSQLRTGVKTDRYPSGRRPGLCPRLPWSRVGVWQRLG
jgi:hypothetical protein